MAPVPEQLREERSDPVRATRALPAEEEKDRLPHLRAVDFPALCLGAKTGSVQNHLDSLSKYLPLSPFHQV